jgi:hypothetical protein
LLFFLNLGPIKSVFCMYLFFLITY